jgi:hypothetical protein
VLGAETHKRTFPVALRSSCGETERYIGRIRAMHEIESLDTVDLNSPYTNNWGERVMKGKHAP